MNIERISLNTEVESLLAAAALPTADLHASDHLQIWGIRSSKQLIGVVGLEVYGVFGLLRSLVVAASHRNDGHGQTLVSRAEAWAMLQGIEAIYLLTTSASPYFERLGYTAAPRSDAPPAIADCAQFTMLCPASAAFMCKQLTSNKTLQSDSPPWMPQHN